MSLKKISKYLPVIGIVIFLYILLKLDFLSLIKEISNIKIKFIIIAILLVFISVINETLKWYSIARVQLINIPFMEAIKINTMCSFYGLITPAKIGTIVRAEFLKKYNNSLGKGVSNFTIDKVLDVASLVFLALVFSFVFKQILPAGYLYYSLFMLLFLVISLVVFRDKERSRKILRVLFKRFIPKKIKERVKNGFYSFYQDMPKKRFFILFFTLNILNWIVNYSIAFFVGLSLGISVPFFYFLAIFPIATLIGLIPITISGLGTREAVLITMFGLFGIAAEKVFSMSLITLMLSGILPALIGSLLILKNIRNR